MKIAYGKLGRSMPLKMEKCGFVGGDNECISVVQELAVRHPDDQFYLVGRNSGETPEEAGLPSNVFNPWVEWAPIYKKFYTEEIVNKGLTINATNNIEVEGHLKIFEWQKQYTIPLQETMDGFVVWIGQHGSTNLPIPGVINKDEVTKPQDAFAHYVTHMLQGINKWRDVDPWNREEVYINADPRNYLKMRDLKWPLRHPVLTQYDFGRGYDKSGEIKHERYGDTQRPSDEWYKATRAVQEGKLWKSQVKNVYARLEPCGVFPGTPVGDMLTFDDNWEGRSSFGLLINEARSYAMKPELTRKYIVKNYVMPLNPTWIHGEWTDKSLEELGITIEGTPFSTFNDLYHSVRCTFTTPSSGSGWATTKPWEAFACGTVVFFHSKYDTQNHILKDADPELNDYLRVISPGSLARKVEEMNTDQEKWKRIVHLQREHYDKAATEKRYLKMIEERIWARELANV
jgi:hypothetical protein